MSDSHDPYPKPRLRVPKGSSWTTFKIPEGMTESDARSRREKNRKPTSRLKMHQLEQANRLPFEEKFLFGNHPEIDILSISQCPGCHRRFKTQWLHSFHWEANAVGDFLCATTKAIVIPHRPSSKSEHRHHHPETTKILDPVPHPFPHSRPFHGLGGSSKLHHHHHHHLAGGFHRPNSVLSKIDSNKAALKQIKKVPLKSKVMMPPPISTTPLSKSALLKSASQAKATGSVATYTLSIPSEDTGQNESVESLLQSNRHYSNGSNYGNKPIHMIATAVQKASKAALEEKPEYEQMKFYSDTYENKKSSSSTSTSSSKSSSHSNPQGHSSQTTSSSTSSHSHGSHGHSSHGHSSHSHKSGSHESERHSVVSEGLAMMSGEAHKSGHSSKTSNQGPSLSSSFKIPFKSKSHTSSGTAVTTASTTSQSPSSGVHSSSSQHVSHSSSSQVASSHSSGSHSSRDSSSRGSSSHSSSAHGSGSRGSSSHGSGSHSSSSRGSSSHGSSSHSSSSHNSSSSHSSSKHSSSKSKHSPSSKSSHAETHHSSSHRNLITAVSTSSTTTLSSSTHSHSATSLSSSGHSTQPTHTSSSSNSGHRGSSGTSSTTVVTPPSYSSTAYKPQPQPSETVTQKIEVKNEELSSPPPPKKKKKKKSKDEPRKILPLKDRLFDPDVHCGVTNSDTGVPCTRSLTCKTHSMSMRRNVLGRSQNFDQLLLEHKKARDAEKAAKVAMEQLPADNLSNTVTQPYTVQVNSPSNSSSKQSTKSKSKNTYTVSIPSPLSASLASASIPPPVPSLNIASPSVSISTPAALPKTPTYIIQTPPQSKPTPIFVPKIEILTDNKSLTSRKTTESPRNTPVVQPPSVARETKSLFEIDSYLHSTGITKTSGSAPKLDNNISTVPTLVNETIPATYGTLTLSQPAKTNTPDYSTLFSSVELPMEIQSNNYGASNFGKPLESRPSVSANDNLCLTAASYQPDDMGLQDPLAAALEMAASAAMGGSVMSDVSHGYSSNMGLMPSVSSDHTSMIGLSSAPAPLLFPTPTVYSSPSTGYNTSGFTVRHPLHAITSSVYTPTVPQSYSMSAAPTYSSNYGVTGADFQTASFHAETSANEYQKEAAYQAAAASYQAANYSSTFTAYSSSATVYQSNPTSRYPTTSVYPKAPSVFPTTTVYPTASQYPPTSSLYPPSLPYQTAASSLFPTEPPLFSIIDDLFSDNPAPISTNSNSIPYMDVNRVDPHLHYPHASASAMPPFHQQPFPVARAPSVAGVPSTLASTMDVNQVRQWGATNTNATGASYNPFSGGTGSSVLVTHQNSDPDNPTMNGSTGGKVFSQSNSLTRKRKKLLAVKKKLREYDSNPGDYLAIVGGESANREFISIDSIIEPPTNKVDSDSENVKNNKEEGETSCSEDIGVQLKSKKWKRNNNNKRTSQQTLVPFETKNTNEGGQPKRRNKEKEPEKEKTSPKIEINPFYMVPDLTKNESISNKIAETSGEAAKAVQESVKAIHSYADNLKGASKRKLEQSEDETHKKSARRHCIDKILSEINEDFHADLFKGTKRLRTKDFSRLFKFNSSLPNDKMEWPYGVSFKRQREIFMNFYSIPPKDSEHSAVFNEIESYIDTIPALVEDR